MIDNDALDKLIAAGAAGEFANFYVFDSEDPAANDRLLIQMSDGSGVSIEASNNKLNLGIVHDAAGDIPAARIR